MAGPAGVTTETLLDIAATPMSSPEPDLQRGRKRRRDFLGVDGGRATIPSGESSTFRGRGRYRSSSRYLDMSSLSRPTSQHRMMAASHCRNFSASPSPSRRKLIRIMQLARDRPRSTSPSRSQSPYAAYTKLETAQHMAKRRQQKTQSRSRAPTSVPMTFEVTPHTNEVRVTAMETIVLPLTATTYKIAAASEVAPAKESGEQE